ncbi:hypothetical protein PR202_ga05978 [Eleusine coracana subsp. coracana]|uniref:E3 ubiquitin protein ligase n=1 Tax=Eleusine coracana subsp. coracana TaxID=191504 RepID=A0AAV5BTM2_ELECO|nr:hypothetical protein PR202_ga05978 [Eleusine coracana subsp. coracana]
MAAARIGRRRSKQASSAPMNSLDSRSSPPLHFASADAMSSATALRIAATSPCAPPLASAGASSHVSAEDDAEEEPKNTDGLNVFDELPEKAGSVNPDSHALSISSSSTRLALVLPPPPPRAGLAPPSSPAPRRLLFPALPLHRRRRRQIRPPPQLGLAARIRRGGLARWRRTVASFPARADGLRPPLRVRPPPRYSSLPTRASTASSLPSPLSSPISGLTARGGGRPERLRARLRHAAPGARIARMDAAALQYENQKLVQQLEAQKAEMHILESKFKELRDGQCSYDRILISLNKMWNQLIDDLVLLGVRAGGDLDNLQALDHEELPEDIFESCPSEEIFLLRLLKSSNLKNNKDSNLLQSVEENLAFRHSTTITLMKSLQEAIASQQARSEYLSVALNGQKSNEDVIVALQNHNDHLKEVVDNASQAISIINEKHKRYLNEIETFKSNHSRELLEIKRLSGELEESIAELEESQRKVSKLLHCSWTDGC